MLGVDGGGTKTVALVAGTDGTVLGSARGGNTSVYDHPDPQDAVAALDDLVRRALHEASAEARDLGSAVFCLAGADWPEDVALLRRALEGRLPGCPVEVVHDSIAHLWAGHPDGVGVAVAFGTYLAVGAGGADGRTWSSSNWLDASGSCGLGDDAVRAVFDAHLGVGPPTSLCEALLDAAGVPSVEALAQLLTGRHSRDRPRPHPGALGPLVLDAAAAGDSVATALVHGRVARMADFVRAAAAQVGLGTPYPVVLGGGPTRHPAAALLVGLREALADAASVTLAHRQPAAGAVVRALRLRGEPPAPDVLARLDATAPAASFYGTLDLSPGQPTPAG